MSAQSGQAAAAAAATQTKVQSSTPLVDKILTDYGRLPDQAAKKRAEETIRAFIEQAVKPGQAVDKDVERTIKFWINELDKSLSAQVNQIMHHEDFQKLESTWRGLHYLVHQSETGEKLKIRVLNVSKRELAKDLEKASEFDQSQLFKKIYTEEYDQLGGYPYGMMVADYEFDHYDADIGALKKIAGVAAAAHAPFVAAASPTMLGFEKDFTKMPEPRDLEKIFSSVEYAPWKSFRASEDSRYVGLTMPRVLARLPYGTKRKQPTIEAFNFEEDVDGTDHHKYLWMNAAWAYASRMTDAYAKHGWFIRSRGVEGGGLVEGLPVDTFATDEGGVAMKCPSEIAISDRRENELSNLGFLPLIHYKNRDCAAFIGAQSCQKPTKYNKAEANANAELSTKFNFIMCVSRFAHYLKAMARDKTGDFMEREDCERWLNNWINDYVIPNPADASNEERAKKPLAGANVVVKAVPGKPGCYQATAQLRPHFQLENLDVSMGLVAEIKKPGSK